MMPVTHGNELYEAVENASIVERNCQILSDKFAAETDRIYATTQRLQTFQGRFHKIEYCKKNLTASAI